MTKFKTLLKISFLTGAVPFVGGWTIFFVWLGARHWFAIDLKGLETTGFFWIIICFFVAISGLLILLTYVLINRNNLHWNMLVVLFILLINIPSVLVVLQWQGKQGRKTFVKLINESEYRLDRIRLSEKPNDPVYIGSLEPKESVIFSYRPKYKPFGDRFFQVADDRKLFFIKSNETDSVSFPWLKRGRCVHLAIDQNLEKVKTVK